MSERPLIDWWLAGRVAGFLAGDGGRSHPRRREIEDMARRSVELIVAYTGLEPEGRLPGAEVIGRREWIDINLENLQSMAAPLERRMAESLRLPGPIGTGARSLAGMAAGVELGLASGYLAQRVLGQYDVALIGPARPPRLLFVGPNLVEAQRKLGGPRRLFLQWIALHEATHAIQFAAVPWLREHIGGMLRELLGEADLRVDSGGLAAALGSLRAADPRRIVAAVRAGDLASLVVSPRQRRLLDGLQSAMAVVEGYSEHVMDAVGEELDPQYAGLRSRLERERRRRSLLDAVVGRMLGLDIKMRQYRQGKAFADEVVTREGIRVLNEVWAAPDALPGSGELMHPSRWLGRVRSPAEATV